MKTTLTTTEAAHRLIDDKNASWSRAGAFALVEYLEALEEDTGEELEFDHVALRCDFAEYSSLTEWLTEYHGQSLADSLEASGIEAEDEDDVDAAIREYIEDRGELIEFDGGVIVSSF